MATAKELRSILRPILGRHDDWRFDRGWLFHIPVGYYLRGIVFKASWTDREQFQILRCVYPLFEWGGFDQIGWGKSFVIPGTTNHGWNVFHPEFAETLIGVIEKEVIPVTERVVNGAEFLHYLTHNYTQHGWQDWGKALAYIHMGELETARKLLSTTAQVMRSQCPRILESDAWGHNLLELLRLIEEDPGAIPAHCEAVARKSVQVNKLEKYWEPVPFVYDKDR